MHKTEGNSALSWCAPVQPGTKVRVALGVGRKLTADLDAAVNNPTRFSLALVDWDAFVQMMMPVVMTSTTMYEHACP